MENSHAADLAAARFRREPRIGLIVYVKPTRYGETAARKKPETGRPCATLFARFSRVAGADFRAVIPDRAPQHGPRSRQDRDGWIPSS